MGRRDAAAETRALGSFLTETKALTVMQPYAELIARGVKPIENRTWATAYRGPLLIHAGNARSGLDEGDLQQYPGMAFGAVVAVATLVACLDRETPWPERWAHLRDHEHANGPVCWVLDDVRRLTTPIPVTGSQGLWTPPSWLVGRLSACEVRA